MKGGNIHDADAQQIKSVTYLGIAVNIFLAVIKIAVGLPAGSLALVADGVHSFSDLATDAVLLLGVRISEKKPDHIHPYGHGRAETFSAGLIALMLVSVGGAMIYYAATAIARREITTPHFGILIAAAASIAAKEWIYRVTRKTAIKSHSPALYANAWHHRSDSLSSVAVLAGFISLQFGFRYGDQVAAITVGTMVIWVGAALIGECLRELAETSVDKQTIEHIKQIINSDSSIRHWHNLRTRTVGREIFLDLHILVDPALNITAAHEISERLETTLAEQIRRPINITVHVEPDTPELRK